MMYQMALSDELIIDNFAGGGGASVGIETALKRPVTFSINHDPEAVALHKANHPHTQHFCEDVWDINPGKLTAGRPVALAWFSPDCKHFSRAKGGKPVEKKIRGLAWVVLKWASLPRPSKPRVICLENVEEFKTWGPLVNDRPCPKRKGETFRSFINALKRQGYDVEYRALRACDYGVPTIRKRLFLVARCDGRPIIWPEPTHGKKGSGLKPYRTAAECIDWDIPCPSIFERKRPLVENTMRRIAKGIRKFVIEAQEPFIIPVGYGERKGQSPRCQSLSDPLNTVVASQKHALVTPFLTEHANSSAQRIFDIKEPLRTQCAQVKGGHFALVSAHIQRQFGQSTGSSFNDPLGTVTSGGGGKSAMVTAFLAKHFGGVIGVEIDKPLPTVLGRGTQTQIVTSHIMKMRGHSSRDKHGHPVTEPLHTVSAGGLHHAEVRAFLLKYYGTNIASDLNKPMHSVTSKDKFGLVTIHGEDYQIVDIGMRMLTPRELYRAQGFPEDYKIEIDFNGKPLTKTAQVRMCGNSVPPGLSEAIIRVNLPESSMYEPQMAEQWG